jgi:hypothetical protein
VQATESLKQKYFDLRLRSFFWRAVENTARAAEGFPPRNDGFIDPVELGTAIDPDGSPLRAGGTGVDPGCQAGPGSVDPRGATDGRDPWGGATPLDPDG